MKQTQDLHDSTIKGLLTDSNGITSTFFSSQPKNKPYITEPWYISSSFIVTEFYKVETVLKRKKKLSHFPNLRNCMLYCIKSASADNILVVIGRWYVPFDFLSFISYICLWFNFKDVSKFTKRKFPQEFDK